MVLTINLLALLQKIFKFSCSVFLYSYCYAWSSSSAVTYHFSHGRLGDNLLTYLHAKWVSYQMDIPVLYKPFPYSDKLAFSEIERVFDDKYQNHTWLSENDDPLQAAHQESTLFHIHYFPEVSWGGVCLRNKPSFHIDWDDPHFRAVIRTAISPKTDLPLTIVPPKNITSVAIHLRTGGRFERDLHDCWALKAPRIDFFIRQLQYLYDFLEHRPLFVYIFTDDEYPDRIKKSFQSEFRGTNIIFTCTEQAVGWDDHVLEDFFSMIQFDCSIHGDSNFSVCAGLVADHDIEIRPLSVKNINQKTVIDEVVMRLHFNKEQAPEYRIISSYR